jgi:hypothetical protein
MPEEHPVLDLIFRRAVTAERRSRALADGRFLNRDLQDHRRRAIRQHRHLARAVAPDRHRTGAMVGVEIVGN